MNLSPHFTLAEFVVSETAARAGIDNDPPLGLLPALKRTALGAMARNLTARAAEWNVLTTAIMLRAPKDKEVVGAASVDYLMYSGFVMMGFYWAQQAAKAEELLASGAGKESEDFYRSKVQTAEFYFERLMPRANAHRTGALAPTKSVMQLDNEHFAFA